MNAPAPVAAATNAEPRSEGTLAAEWTAQESDFRYAMSATPGSWLQPIRMPVLFVLMGIGIAGKPASPLVIAFSIVLAVALAVMMVSARKVMFKKIAALPEDQRANRIAVDGDSLRLRILGLEAARPIRMVTRVRTDANGILLDVRGNVLFVPQRALAREPEAWRAFFSQIPARKWSLDILLTAALWAGASAFALYKHFR